MYNFYDINDIIKQKGGESMNDIIRNKTIIVKVSEQEKRIIERAAHIHGETMSNYIRRTLMIDSRKED